MPRKRRKSRAFMFVAAAVLILSVVSLGRTYAANKVLLSFTEDTTELDVIDLKYEPGPVLYLAAGCNGIRMGITDDQAFSIRESLTKNMFSRPLTHDLAFEVMNSYRIKLLYAKIDSMENGIYTAKLLFSDGSNLNEADARPSDMAAFTLRYGNKFAVSDSLLSNMTYVC